jgi:hypothetical protein
LAAFPGALAEESAAPVAALGAPLAPAPVAGGLATFPAAPADELGEDKGFAAPVAALDAPLAPAPAPADAALAAFPVVPAVELGDGGELVAAVAALDAPLAAAFACGRSGASWGGRTGK